MKIAVCDDERNIAEMFADIVRETEPTNEIIVYTSGIDLINSHAVHDVVFLDIDMEIMDGFRVAEILNNKQPECVFSFITTHAELAVDGYEYQPFRYILKTAPKQVIKRKISETIHEYQRRNRSIRITYKGKHCRIFVNDIYYIEIKGHCMNIVLQDNEVLWNKPLNEAEKELVNCGLVRCHRSFIVSLSSIKEFSMKEINMKNGHNVPIGRAYRRSFMESYRSNVSIAGGK